MNESNLKTLEQFLGTPINQKVLEELKKAVSRETGWPECELVCEVDDRGIVTVSRKTDKVGRNLKEKKRIARKQKKLGRRRNRRT